MTSLGSTHVVEASTVILLEVLSLWVFTVTLLLVRAAVDFALSLSAACLFGFLRLIFSD